MKKGTKMTDVFKHLCENISPVTKDQLAVREIIDTLSYIAETFKTQMPNSLSTPICDRVEYLKTFVTDIYKEDSVLALSGKGIKGKTIHQAIEFKQYLKNSNILDDYESKFNFNPLVGNTPESHSVTDLIQTLIRYFIRLPDLNYTDINSYTLTEKTGLYKTKNNYYSPDTKTCVIVFNTGHLDGRLFIRDNSYIELMYHHPYEDEWYVIDHTRVYLPNTYESLLEETKVLIQKQGYSFKDIQNNEFLEILEGMTLKDFDNNNKFIKAEDNEEALIVNFLDIKVSLTVTKGQGTSIITFKGDPDIFKKQYMYKYIKSLSE